MVPFHLWLISAHVEAPTAGSVLLAAILLKLGSYGFIRYSICLFPEASHYFTCFISCLCLVAIIYTSVACLAQLDLKKLIAYSSIGHMNTSVIGLFSNDYHGISASILFLISHGIISSALFLLIGAVYDRYHTRRIKYYRGIVLLMPIFTLILFIFTLANAAVPGTSGFISELLVFLGLYHLNPLVVFAALAIILTPCYALWLFHRVSYGLVSNYLPTLFQDLTVKEFHLFLPLLFFTFLFGLSPQLLLKYLHWIPIATHCCHIG
jgi:proton-translocating NADH-quinone oxidoreductase chain M